MTTTIQVNDGNVIICFDGHLDTATSAEANAKISRGLDKMDTIVTLTCDASRLEYISSSGLRVLMMAIKEMGRRHGAIRITNVSENVYDILESTGFTGASDVEPKP